MAGIELQKTISDVEQGGIALLLRPHRRGDIGWIIHRYGVLYAQKYGWTTLLRLLSPKLRRNSSKNFDARCDRCWIAERDGTAVGSVFPVKYRSGREIAAAFAHIQGARTRNWGALGSEMRPICALLRLSEHHFVDASILIAAQKLHRSAGFRRVKAGLPARKARFPAR
jgi:hypothetical protein